MKKKRIAQPGLFNLPLPTGVVFFVIALLSHAAGSAVASAVYDGPSLLTRGAVDFAISNSAIAWEPVINHWTNLPDMVHVDDYFAGGSAGISGPGVFYAMFAYSSRDLSDNHTKIPSSTPTPTPTCTPSELIVNGGFETGNFTGWTIDGTNNSPVITSNNPHSGTYTAFVGGNPPDYCGSSFQGPNGNSSFHQQFTVPANGGVLGFWHWDCSIENLDHAWQDAYITDSSDTILQTIFHQCANEQTWLNTQVNVAAYAGQSIRVKFLVHQDGFLPLTGMYVDDVSLVAPCGTPTPTPTPTPTSAPSCPPGGLRVLIVQADGMPDATLSKDLLAEGASVVDDFDARSGTPTLEQLLGYEIVVPFSNYPYADPTTLGNNLADYLDVGGVVVAFADDWFGGNQSIQGRWLTGNYTPFNNPGTLIVENGTLGSCTFSLLCDRVTTLNALFRETVTLSSGATQAATWNDGSILMAYKGRAVALSAYVGDSSDNWSGDYGRVVMNAGRWLYACPTPTPSPTPTATPTPTPTPTSTPTVITVTNTNDNGPGSLRQVLADAIDGDTINFAVTGTIGLTSGELLVDHNITISGPGAENLAVNGNAKSTVFHIAPGETVTISGLTITNGYTTGSGGGIHNNHAALTLNDCTINSNQGGGIYNDAEYQGSGGMYATLEINSSSVTDNSGRGIYNDAQGGGTATLEITDSILSNNSGNAIYSHGWSCTFCGNGIATVQITNSSITDNPGGSIYSDTGGYCCSVTVSITSSTISGNAGAAVYNSTLSTTSLSNSTISGNSGGGIYSDLSTATGGAYIDNSTMSDNSVEIYAGYNGTYIENTIFNVSPGGHSIVSNYGPVTSNGYNISSDDGGGYLSGPGDQINTDPLLGPLQDNGGPTFTHALVPGSPAINAGDPNFVGPPDYDQRGPGFDRVRGGRIDIGSFEVQNPPPPSPTPTATSMPRPTPTPRIRPTPAPRP